MTYYSIKLNISSSLVITVKVYLGHKYKRLTYWISIFQSNDTKGKAINFRLAKKYIECYKTSLVIFSYKFSVCELSEIIFNN